ncbi:hypothetical protein ACFLYX_02180 [Chloroflexota bacterium]
MDNELNKLYSKLKETYIRNKQGKTNKSVLLGLVDLSSKTRRMRLLKDAAVPVIQIDQNNIKELFEFNLIQYIDQGKNITLTSKGIWQAEKSLGLLEDDTVTDYIENKWFECFKDINQELVEREKIILFTTLAVRAFSEQSSVNLKKGDRVDNAWRDAVEKAFDFLLENGIIKDKTLKEALFGGEGYKPSLNPVKNCFRYSENLPKKTNGLYVAKSLKYFLNLENTGEIDINDLVFLFEAIFKDKVDFELMEKINSFCRDMSYAKSAQVFDNHIFASPSYDDLVKESLRKMVMKI